MKIKVCRSRLQHCVYEQILTYKNGLDLKLRLTFKYMPVFKFISIILNSSK